MLVENEMPSDRSLMIEAELHSRMTVLNELLVQMIRVEVLHENGAAASGGDHSFRLRRSCMPALLPQRT